MPIGEIFSKLIERGEFYPETPDIIFNLNSEIPANIKNQYLTERVSGSSLERDISSCGLKQYATSSPRNSKFEGIFKIKFMTLNDKVIEYSIEYWETSRKWLNTDEFISALTNSLTLPNNWIAESSHKIATCNGFSTDVLAMDTIAKIKISDKKAIKEVVNSCIIPTYSKAKEEQNKTFKP